MSERFTEYPQGYYLITCDVCYKTDTETLTNGIFEKFWTDKDSGLTLCDDCKKREEVITNG